MAEGFTILLDSSTAQAAVDALNKKIAETSAQLHGTKKAATEAANSMKASLENVFSGAELKGAAKDTAKLIELQAQFAAHTRETSQAIVAITAALAYMNKEFDTQKIKIKDNVDAMERYDREINKANAAVKNFNLAQEKELAVANQTVTIKRKLAEQMAVSANLKNNETRAAMQTTAFLKSANDIEMKNIALKQQALILSSEKTAKLIKENFAQELANKKALESLKVNGLLEASKAGLITLTERELVALRYARMAQISYEDALRRVDAQLRRKTKSTAAATAATETYTGATRRASLAQRGFRIHLFDADAAAAGFRAGLRAMGTSIGMFTSATILAATAVYGVIAAFRGAISSGAEFEFAMAKSLAVMGIFDDASFSARALEQEVRRLGATTMVASDEVAKGLSVLGMAGLQAGEALQALAPTVRLSIIGMMDMEKAADVTTGLLAGFGLQASSLNELVDDMATTVVNSKTTIEQLGTAMSYAAPVANTLGISFQDVIAAVSTLQNANIKASRAGTGLRRVMLNLYNPTVKGAKALHDLGVSASDMEGRSRPLVEVVYDLAEAWAEGGDKAQQMTDIVGVRMMPVLAALVDSVERGEKSLGAFRDALDDNLGDAQRMADRYQDTVMGKWEIFKSAATDWGITLFEGMRPFIRNVLDLGADFFNWMNGLSQRASEFNPFREWVQDFWGRDELSVMENEVFGTLDSIASAMLRFGDITQDTAASLVNLIAASAGLDFKIPLVRVRQLTAEMAQLENAFERDKVLAKIPGMESSMDDAVAAAERLYEVYVLLQKAGEQIDMAKLEGLLEFLGMTQTDFMQDVGGHVKIAADAFEEFQLKLLETSDKVEKYTQAEVKLQEVTEKISAAKQAANRVEEIRQEKVEIGLAQTQEQKDRLADLNEEEQRLVTVLREGTLALDERHGAESAVNTARQSALDRIRESISKMDEEVDANARLAQVQREMEEILPRIIELKFKDWAVGELTQKQLDEAADLLEHYLELRDEERKITEDNNRAYEQYVKDLEKLKEQYRDLTKSSISYGSAQEAIADITSKMVPIEQELSRLHSSKVKESMNEKKWYEQVNKLLEERKDLSEELKKVLMDMAKKAEKAANDAAKAEEKRLQKLKDLAREYGSISVLTEDYRDKLKDLKELYEENYLSATQYAEAVREINKEFELATASNAVEEMLVEWKYQFEELDEVAAGWLEGFADSLAEFVRTGKADFKDLVDSILADLARLVARQFVVSIGASFGIGGGGGGFGGGGGGGNIFSSLFGSNSEGEPFRLSDIGKSIGQMFSPSAASAAPLDWAAAGQASAMGVNPGTQLALLEGSYGPSSAPLFGGTAMGYGMAGMGGSLIGGWIAPDSPYGSIMGSLGGMAGYGLGAGMGASGGMLAGTQFAALAGPIGAVVGAVLGSVLSKVFDKAPRAAFLNTSTEDASDSPYKKPGWEDGMEGGHYVETPFGYMGLSDRTRDISGADEKAITDGLKDLADLDKLISDALGKDRTEMAKEALHNYKYFDKSGGGGLEEFGLGRIEIMAESTDLDFGDYVMQGNPDLEEAGTRLITVAEVQKYIDEAGGLEREDMLRRNTSGADIEHFAQAATTLVDIETYMEEIGKELKFQDMMWQQIENNLGDSEALAKLRDYVVAMVAIDDYMTADFMADYQEGVEEANKSLTDKYYEQIDSVYELIDTYDGSIDKTIELGQALTTQYENTVALIGLIESMKVSVADMFASTSEKIMLSGMDDKEKFDYYRTGADSLTEQLATETDPEKIAKLTEEINSKINSSWDLLDEDQQDQKRQEYLDYLDDVNELAQERLDIAEEEAINAANELKTAIEEAFGPIAADFQTAADDMGTAANTPVNVNVDVDVDVTGPGSASYETSYEDARGGP